MMFETEVEDLIIENDSIKGVKIKCSNNEMKKKKKDYMQIKL